MSIVVIAILAILTTASFALVAAAFIYLIINGPFRDWVYERNRESYRVMVAYYLIYFLSGVILLAVTALAARKSSVSFKVRAFDLLSRPWELRLSRASHHIIFVYRC